MALVLFKARLYQPILPAPTVPLETFPFAENVCTKGFPIVTDTGLTLGLFATPLPLPVVDKYEVGDPACSNDPSMANPDKSPGLLILLILSIVKLSVA